MCGFAVVLVVVVFCLVYVRVFSKRDVASMVCSNSCLFCVVVIDS